MQSPLPLGFNSLLHHQFQFLALHVSQEAQQGLNFCGGQQFRRIYGSGIYKQWLNEKERPEHAIHVEQKRAVT